MARLAMPLLAFWPISANRLPQPLDEEPVRLRGPLPLSVDDLGELVVTEDALELEVWWLDSGVNSPCDWTSGAAGATAVAKLAMVAAARADVEFLVLAGGVGLLLLEDAPETSVFKEGRGTFLRGILWDAGGVYASTWTGWEFRGFGRSARCSTVAYAGGWACASCCSTEAAFDEGGDGGVEDGRCVSKGVVSCFSFGGDGG